MVSVKVSGALEGCFKCKFRLKHGDPLSPYLFVIAIEVLKASINHLISSRVFNHHNNSKEAGISHLIFADDVPLFC